MLVQTEILQSFALEAAQEALKLLKAAEDDAIPVIIHSFSGAGCIVLEQLEILVSSAKEAEKSKSATQQQRDLALLGQAIHRGGQIFDSCPAYLHLTSGLNAVQQAVPNRVVRLLIQIIYMLLSLIKWAIIRISGGLDFPANHWAHFENSSIADRQAYVYSTIDGTTDPAKLGELIEHRKQRPGATIIVKKFNDSRHCAHLVKHAKEYETLLDIFLASIAEQKMENDILDEDPDMTDYQLEMD